MSTMTIVPQKEPISTEGQAVDVQNRVEVHYWFHEPFLTSGPYSEESMRIAVKQIERFSAKGTWWEKETRATTVIREKVMV